MDDDKKLAPWKANFLDAIVSGGVLKFGTFELKAGRISPYFFNAGAFDQADLLHAISTAIAHTIIEAREQTGLQFDVLFGPAYKGIPLATGAAFQLAMLDPARYGKIKYAFDRKTAKTYGDGGIIVGAALKDRRVLIVDDVITAGTAKREAIDIIRKEGGTVVGIVVAVDRMEKIPAPDGDDNKAMPSAGGVISKEYGIPLFSVLTLDDIIDGMGSFATDDDIKRTLEYRAKYKASD